MSPSVGPFSSYLFLVSMKIYCTKEKGEGGKGEGKRERERKNLQILCISIQVEWSILLTSYPKAVNQLISFLLFCSVCFKLSP